MRWCGGAALPREGFLLAGRWGPALLPRDVNASCPLGVPGPREDCRNEDEVAGIERWCGFSLRRFGSIEGERLPLREGCRCVDGETTALFEATEVFKGDGWRADGWTRRVKGLLAMVVEGPALPESGFRGVEAPVVLVEPVNGGRRVEREVLCRRDGSCGSGWMAPSFWRSRILKSRRLICLSSKSAAFSLKPTFSS